MRKDSKNGRENLVRKALYHKQKNRKKFPSNKHLDCALKKKSILFFVAYFTANNKIEP